MNLTHGWPQSGHFFPKLGYVFPVSEKGQGRPPHSPQHTHTHTPHLVTCLLGLFLERANLINFKSKMMVYQLLYLWWLILTVCNYQANLFIVWLKASMTAFCTSSVTACPHFRHLHCKSQKIFDSCWENGIIFRRSFKESFYRNFFMFLIKCPIIFINS